MTLKSAASLRVITEPRPLPILPSAVRGVLIFVVAELMMFAGLISAYSIVKAGALGWPPPGQPRLPVPPRGGQVNPTDKPRRRFKLSGLRGGRGRSLRIGVCPARP